MVKGTYNAIEDSRNEIAEIIINGAFFTRNQAKISVFGSGYLVGDEVWQASRLHHNHLPFLTTAFRSTVARCQSHWHDT